MLSVIYMVHNISKRASWSDSNYVKISAAFEPPTRPNFFCCRHSEAVSGPDFSL